MFRSTIMLKYTKLIIFFSISILFYSTSQAQLRTGAEQLPAYLPLLKGKKIALVVNQTSIIGKKHLVDSLLSLKVSIKTIFAPEHGFRGDHSAGATVNSSIDEKTKLPIISLYGKHKKPTITDLEDVQLVIFDIQDVGARFYTYISTLHYIMEACAEQGKQLIILDRPNPNGHYVDGPVLQPQFKSFVGMHPIPIVHGMTVGEYAHMINGEKWLNKGVQCKLKVIKDAHYSHDTMYQLPVKPSPNLPTMQSIYLYPSVCLFEGTSYSLGRGTDKPFECIGKPGNAIGDYSFTPRSIPGVAEHPPHEGKECKGFLLTSFADNYIKGSGKLYLSWLTEFHKDDPDSAHFFIDFFDTLAGTDQLRKDIAEGKSEGEIRSHWKKDLDHFKQIRKKYLLYPDFTLIISNN
jgi:uncharacterized protein YbbC (DUF1343 family)